MPLYSFGETSNIILEANPDDVLFYNELVLKSKDERIEADIQKYPSYVAVTTLVGKKAKELIDQGIDPILELPYLKEIVQDRAVVENTKEEEK